MDHSIDRALLKSILTDLHQDNDYKHTLKSALDSAANNVPLLTNIAITVDSHLGGSLGTRSTRKQLQSIMHHAAGNMEMRVNSSSAVPSTFFLPICAAVGSGKTEYSKFLKKVMVMLCKGTEVLDKQIFDHNNVDDHVEEVKNSAKKEKKFISRKLRRAPATKEGQEFALHQETEVIQLVEEGDLQWDKMSKNAKPECRGLTLSQINELIDGSTMLVEFKTTGLTTRATNINNTIVTYGHPEETLMIMDSLKSCGVQIRHQQLFDPAKDLSVPVSKTRNDFRGGHDGKRRLTALQMMRMCHNRSKEKIQVARKEKRLLVGLHALFQTAVIFFQYGMSDGTSILLNVEQPQCVRDELEKEKENPNLRDIDTSSENACNSENQSQSPENDIMRTHSPCSEDGLVSNEEELSVPRSQEQSVGRSRRKKVSGKEEKVHERAAFSFIRPGAVIKIHDVNTVLINPSTI